MDWFRFYHGVVHDPKVQRLRAELFRTWINMLCLASGNNPRGMFPPLDDIAFSLHMSRAKTEESIAALVDANLIDRLPSGELMPHNWDERQPSSDNVAERVRKHREKQRVTLHVTEEKRTCIVPDSEERREFTHTHGARVHAHDAPAPVPAPAPARETPESQNGTVGPNIPADVKRVLDLAEEIDPMGSLRTWANQWLHDYPAGFIVECLAKSRGKSDPGSYAGSLLKKGPPKDVPPARASPPANGGKLDYAAGEKLMERIKAKEAKRG